MKRKYKLKTLTKLGQELKQNPEFIKEYQSLNTWSVAVDKLIELREQQGLTQAELGKRLKTAQPAIARLESGRYNPTVKFLDKLAKVLGKRLEIRFV